VVLAKIMPMANVNRSDFLNLQSLSQFGTIRQPIAVWHIFFYITNKFCTFLLGREIADSYKMTDSAVLFHKPIATGKNLLE